MIGKDVMEPSYSKGAYVTRESEQVTMSLQQCRVYLSKPKPVMLPAMADASDSSIPRRRFQFRLRTLMIVVTVVAVACGYASHEVRIVKERRKAAETYEPLRESVTKIWGGRLEYSSRTVLIEAP